MIRRCAGSSVARKVAEGKLGEPQWPDMDFLEAIHKGFKKTGIVDKADHPLIKRLHGLSI
jgi:hypothetical protein